jgi:cytochrome P450
VSKNSASIASHSIKRPTCPVAHGAAFDPYSIEFAENGGEAWLGPARAQAPVFFDEALGAWCVTRYDDIVDALRQPEMLSSRKSIELRPFWPELEAVYPEGHPVERALVMSDPPDHTRRRKLVNQALTPRAVALMEPRVRLRCDQLIDAFIDRGACDFVAEFAGPLPVQVISDMIGAQPGREEDLVAWASDTFALIKSAPPLSAQQQDEMVDRARAMLPWLEELVDARRRTPTDDVCSALVHAETDDGLPTFTTSEVISIINGLFTAGTHTTTIFITFLIRRLLQRRDVWERVMENRELLPAVMDEVLRLWAPVRVARRVANFDTTIGDVAVAAGDEVILLLGSANRDEEAFSGAAEFDPHRAKAKRHLSFGRFTHMCIGAPLARLEAAIAIERIMDRLPNVRLADPAPSWEMSLLTPRLSSLQLEWDHLTMRTA